MAHWTQEEDELIISDYFQMLNAELRGLPYNKSQHRKKLLALLKNRNEGAIEFKHCNISAVLMKYGMPYINGYKPRHRYQVLLEEEVLTILHQQKGIDEVFSDFALKPISEKSGTVAFDKWKVKAPKAADEKAYTPRIFKPVKRNYLEIEQNNQSIGEKGEKLVFDYEIWKLHKAELPKLATQVKWVSKDLGDGAGYDILSKDTNGRDMFIEVKTTKLGIESPIFFSNNEFEFSKDKKDAFFLYRVFNVKADPKMFIRSHKFQRLSLIFSFDGRL